MHRNKHIAAGFAGGNSLRELGNPNDFPHGRGPGRAFLRAQKRRQNPHAQPNHSLLEKVKVRKLWAKKRAQKLKQKARKPKILAYSSRP